MKFNFDRDSHQCYLLAQSQMPFRTGNLRLFATKFNRIDDITYLIKIDGDIAPYAQYLENGTSPHDIPGAFGFTLPFGIGGRFNGMFHPGSTKHMGFIENKIIPSIIHYFTSRYTTSYVSKQTYEDDIDTMIMNDDEEVYEE